MQNRQFFSKFLILFLISINCFAKVPKDLLIKGNPPKELPKTARLYVDMETKGNPVETWDDEKRSNKAFWLEHVEIPMEMISEDRSLNLDEKIFQSLVFERDGTRYVRWILNPEDTVFGEELVKHFQARGVNLERKKYFIGYLTASRSCIVQDPASGYVFSFKSSTNNTGGNWKGKKVTVNAARAARMLTDYLQRESKTDGDSNLKFTGEPLAFWVSALDQSFIVRQYDHFNDPLQTRYLIPFFSAMDDRAGVKIAKRNKTDDIQSFWLKHGLNSLGKALAELYLKYGIYYNSPHGQNFMIELDERLPPVSG